MPELLEQGQSFIEVRLRSIVVFLKARDLPQIAERPRCHRLFARFSQKQQGLFLISAGKHVIALLQS